MPKQKFFAFLLIVLLIIFSGCKDGDKSEVTVEDAIRIALKVAEKKKYNTEPTDIEVMKVKKSIERGPIRLVWLLRYFQKEEEKTILENEFWIVYFYPKGLLEDPRYLGGEFCVLVELYSGKVLTVLDIP